MTLGVRYELGTISPGDTAELYASLQLRGQPAGVEEIAGVTYYIQQPNGTILEPEEGSIEEDGRGYLQWTNTSEIGEYVVQAQFLLTTGEVRSVLLNFTVLDPFDKTPPSLEEIVADDVWMRLEDCFDEIEGGPYLRKVTRAHFDRAKIKRYIPDALLDINVQMPLSNSTLAEFALPQNNQPNELLPLISKGVLCKVMMHLIRSYVEIPVPQGAQIVYEDRTRYKDAWKAAYDVEHQEWYTMVRLWKRGLLRLGHSKLLVISKAGRLYYGTNMRLQNVGRGLF